MKKLLSSLILYACSSLAHAVPILEDSTFGLSLDFPQVQTNPVGSVVYDVSTQTLTLDSQPLVVFFDSGAANIGIVTNPSGSGALGGLLNLSATVSSSGELLGGIFTMTGFVNDPFSTNILGATLLSGNLLFGAIVDGGSTDVAEFVVSPATVAGDLYDFFPQNTFIGMNFQLVNSTYGQTTAQGSSGFSENWQADAAKGIVGSLGDLPSITGFPPVPEPPLIWLWSISVVIALTFSRKTRPSSASS